MHDDHTAISRRHLLAGAAGVAAAAWLPAFMNERDGRKGRSAA